MRLAHQIVVVSRIDVPGLKLARKYLKQLVRNDVPQEKLHLVANRAGHREQLPTPQIEKALEMPITEWLPEDPSSLVASLNDGQPLVQVAPSARITKRLASLAHRLNGQTDRTA